MDTCFQDIKFPMMLDVFDLCTESLQKKLMPAREKFKIEDDKRVERASKVDISLQILCDL